MILFYLFSVLSSPISTCMCEFFYECISLFWLFFFFEHFSLIFVISNNEWQRAKLPWCDLRWRSLKFAPHNRSHTALSNVVCNTTLEKYVLWPCRLKLLAVLLVVKLNHHKKRSVVLDVLQGDLSPQLIGSCLFCLTTLHFSFSFFFIALS